MIVKHILLPTDFSENSLNAIHYAAALLKDSQCRFYVLNVQKSSEYIMDDIVGTSNNKSIYEAIVSDNKKKLAALLDELKTTYNTFSIKWHALFDFDVFVDAIKQVVKTKNIDLIIMGTNGATGASEVLFGSNTLRVVRRVDCPVLMVPEGYHFQQLDSILFSTTDCKELQKETIQVVKELGKQHTSLLHVLNIHTAINELESSHELHLNEVLEGLRFQEYTLKGIPVPFAIESFEQLFPVAMNVMFVPKESFLNRFMFGSQTSRISHGSVIPLLFLHKSN